MFVFFARNVGERNVVDVVGFRSVICDSFAKQTRLPSGVAVLFVDWISDNGYRISV